MHVAWPIGISRTQKVKQVISKKKGLSVGSYALTGVTLTTQERKPIKKTLIFPHRMFELPFRQPTPNVRFDTINHFSPYSNIFLLSRMSFWLLVPLIPCPLQGVNHFQIVKFAIYLISLCRSNESQYSSRVRHSHKKVLSLYINY